MTIFAVIKYPLSSPPTKKELMDLPQRTFEGWSIDNKVVHSINLFYFLDNTFRNNKDTYDYLITALKRNIYNLDEP